MTEVSLADIAMADAAIALLGSEKYHYVFWRPFTAIPLADTDGNPATSSDPAWMPLFATPAHPEYPSGHSTVSGAADVEPVYMAQRHQGEWPPGKTWAVPIDNMGPPATSIR